MSARGDRVNVLLVDDQPDSLLALEAALAPLGENLVLARNGREIRARRLIAMDRRARAAWQACASYAVLLKLGISFVIAGLDPAIHDEAQHALAVSMDARAGKLAQPA